MNFTTIVRNLILALTMGFMAASGLAAKPGDGGGGGGGGGKVSVTAAEPSDANQGEELDVVISGKGFDDGSAATFFITETDDDSHITVLSNEYLPATGQLKALIRVQGTAAVSDYDIEVQNSRGRRGKGTTLFKVKSLSNECSGSETQSQTFETVCSGTESTEPKIAYLTEYQCEDGMETSDIMLLSESGCDHYALLESAGQRLLDSSGTPTEYITEVLNLRLDIRDGQGIVIWIDPTHAPWPVTGLRFVLDENGSPVSDPVGPEPLYLSPEPDRIISAADVRFNDFGEIELVVLERLEDYGSERQVALVNVDSGARNVISPPFCLESSCFRLSGFPWWNDDGTEIYAYGADTSASGSADVRLKFDGLDWQFEIVVVESGDFMGVSPGGLVGSSRLEADTTKKGKGKPGNNKPVYRVFDPQLCVPTGCELEEGFELPHTTEFDDLSPRGWTADGELLFRRRESNSVIWLKKFADPWTAEVADFKVGPIYRDQYDITR